MKGGALSLSIKKRIIVYLLLLVTAGTMFVGYAAVADTLFVGGEAAVEGKPYEGVYITDVAVVASSGATSNNNDYVLPTNHLVSATPGRSGGSITYKITVFNNTTVTHWYLGTQYDADYGSNSMLGSGGGITVVTKDHQADSGATFNTGDWIPPETSRDFYVTYTYSSASQSPRQTFINFSFGVRMDAVHDEFLAVLNDRISEVGYNYLSGVFDHEYATEGSTRIDSVNNADIFSTLFDGLTVDVDGEKKQATVVVERKNMDGKSTGDSYENGPSGCEYTVYITVEDPNASDKVTVYAISYSYGTNSTGQWYQIGELYEGTASTTADGTFDTSSWKATAKTYTIADGITYKVGQQNGDQYEIMKDLDDILSVQDQNIFNTIDNTRIFKKVYDILKSYQNSTDPAVAELRTTFESLSPYYNNFNNGQEFKVIRSYTKSEIIPAIESLQHALDYFYQAYPG